MNERIKELADEAGLRFTQLMSNPMVPVVGFGKETDLEKFAELIIQECLNICEDMGDNGKDGHYCADKIAKTFRS